MAKINPHFEKLKSNYLFPEIEKKVVQQKLLRPNASFINLGVGDVTQPISPHLLSALCIGAQEMGEKNTFRGYGPSAGYPFLREAIALGDYGSLGIAMDEIFVSNGAKCDLAHIQELFSQDSTLAVCDPTYPVYVDTNVMAGRTQGLNAEGRYIGIHYITCQESNGFLPLPPPYPCDLLYLCSPNNPTGVAFNRTTLRAFVDYALMHRTVIVYDGAYYSYITSEDCPKSIYELEGAKECAIEIRSFSKTAGFTGLRCSYTVIPKELTVDFDGKEIPLHTLWMRRQNTKFGGVPYPIQKCAAAIYSQQGKIEVENVTRLYSERARFLAVGLQKLGFTIYGGIDAPYIWCKTPNGITSWDFFDLLLEQASIITVPGCGFGQAGKGFIRLSAFAEPTAIAESLLRIKTCKP